MILVMGTAMWGWKIDRETAFILADHFVESGGKWFDTASNYPIDRKPAHYGLAEQWLSEWISSRNVNVSVILKVGSLVNDGSPRHDLAPEFLNAKLGQAESRFGTSLRTVAIHWDDRSDRILVGETIAFFRTIKSQGMGIGMSGICHPDIYADLAPDLYNDWQIQIKFNPLSWTAYSHYKRFQGRRRFWAYGLNAGGLNFSGSYTNQSSTNLRGSPIEVSLTKCRKFVEIHRADRNCPRSLNELALLCAASFSDISGVLISVSNLEQLSETLNAARSTYSPELIKAAHDFIINAE